MENEIAERNLKQEKKLFKLISLIQKEVEGPATYYVIDKICDKLNLTTPPLNKVVDQLIRREFPATFTHFSSNGLRTDAPIETVKEIIILLNR